MLKTFFNKSFFKKQKNSIYDKKFDRLFQDYSTLKSNFSSSDGSESRNHTVGDELIFLESNRIQHNDTVTKENYIKFWGKRSSEDILDNFMSNTLLHFGDVFKSKKFRYLRNKKDNLLNNKRFGNKNEIQQPK